MIDREAIEIDRSRQGPVLIAGPTASGKSSLALRLAQRYDGEIINADAMQVYRDLPVLTACPTAAEEAQIPHHLYRFLDGAARCSAGIWAREAGRSVEAVLERGKCPIVVGGTGLYFRALMEGLSPIPDVPDETRRAGEDRYRALGAAAFRDEVVAIDPAMARLPAADRQRLVRAWSVYHETATPLSIFQQQPREPLVTRAAAKFILVPDRHDLYARCDERFGLMLAQGALEEVAGLRRRGLGADLPIMKSLGVRELSAYLAGEVMREAAIAAAQQSTRRFAKRQLTWFRNQLPDWIAAR